MNRNSIQNQTNNNPVLYSLRSKIKLIENEPRNPTILPMEIYDPIYSNTTVQIEVVIINKRYYNVRRVYMLNNKYRIGWIVDWDIQSCMNCNKDFGWIYGRFKHHCRACGNLICHDCSPYLSNIAGIDEPKGSRVCVNCFGLKTPGTSPKLDHSKLNEIQNISNKSENQNINHIGSSNKSTSSNSIKSSSIKSEEVDDDILLRGSIRRKKHSHGSAGSGSINNNHNTNHNNTSSISSNNGLSPFSTATITSAMGGIPVDFDKQIEEFEREQLPLYERDYRS